MEVANLVANLTISICEGETESLIFDLILINSVLFHLEIPKLLSCQSNTKDAEAGEDLQGARSQLHRKRFDK